MLQTYLAQFSTIGSRIKLTGRHWRAKGTRIDGSGGEKVFETTKHVVVLDNELILFMDREWMINRARDTLQSSAWDLFLARARRG